MDFQTVAYIIVDLLFVVVLIAGIVRTRKEKKEGENGGENE